jgi:predicted RNA methylase
MIGFGNHIALILSFLRFLPRKHVNDPSFSTFGDGDDARRRASTLVFGLARLLLRPCAMKSRTDRSVDSTSEEGESRSRSARSKPFASIVRQGPPCAHALALEIASGSVPSDHVVDALLPLEYRLRSSMFWTPVSVALCVARWLRHHNVSSVLDVGSGVGKFCAIAACVSNATFVGIEQRPALIEAGRALCRSLGVEHRVQFIAGEFGATTIPRVSAYYCFNPFGEHLFEDGDRIDHTPPLGMRRFRRDAAAMSQVLREASVGTLFCTYNGFGGLIPRTYDLVATRDDFACPLRLWKKNRESSSLPDVYEHELTEQALIDAWLDSCS